MKSIRISVLSLLIVGAITLANSCTPDYVAPAQTYSVALFAEMGYSNIDSGHGGPCDGMGLCSAVQSQSQDNEAIPVAFSFTNISPLHLSLSFKYSMLLAFQPTRAAAIPTGNYSNANYIFVNEFFLTYPMFQALNLPGSPGTNYKIVQYTTGSISKTDDDIVITVPIVAY